MSTVGGSATTSQIWSAPPEAKRYAAFVSSCTNMSGQDSEAPDSEIRHVRSSIAAGAEACGGSFVSEINQKDLTRERYGSLTIARFLLQQVAACDKFIFILSGDGRGRSVDLDQQTLTGTFFELELFQAAVLGKPIYQLNHRGSDTKEVIELLRLFDFEFVQEAQKLKAMNGDELVEAAIAIAGGDPTAERWRIRPHLISSQRVYERLMRRRDANFGANDRDAMHFLDLRRAYPLAGRSGTPDFGAIETLISIRRKDKLGSRMDEQLAWAWLVMRELLVARLIEKDGSISVRDPQILSAWNLALTTWHRAASWSGMHGHTRLGVLPTLVTLGSVREAIRRDRLQPSSAPDAFNTATVDPQGAFASSYYSLAKLLAPIAKTEVIARVHLCLDAATGTDPEDRPGICAVRASTYLLQGEPRKAVQEFEESIRLRRPTVKNEYELGGITCEIGFAQLKAGDLRRGRKSLQQGVTQLKEARHAGELLNEGGFVRALVKASYGSLLTGHLIQAARYLDEAYGVAKDSGVTAYLVRPELKYAGKLIYQARRTYERRTGR